MEIINNILSYIVIISVELLVAGMILASHQRRRKYFWVRLGIAVITFYVIFAIAPGEGWWLSIMRHQITDTIRVNHFYTFVFALTVLIILFCFEINIQGALFYGACAYLLQHLSDNLVGLIIEGLDLIFPALTDISLGKLFMLFVYGGLVAGLYFVMRGSIKHRNSINIVSFSGLIASTLALVFSAYGRQLFQSLLRGLSGDKAAIMNFYNIFAIVLSVIILFLLIYIYDKKDIKRENAELERLLKVQGDMHDNSVANIEQLNIKAHDLKKQITFIRNIKDEEEKNDLLKKTEQTILDFHNVTIDTGNKSLDIVLVEKTNYCDGNNIKFSYMADGSSINHLNATDIYALFTNALDNAIECVNKYGKEKRIISLKLSRKGKLAVLSVENYCDSDIAYENGLPITTKDDKNVHGYGVKSINYLAKKYHGALKIKSENKSFILTIVLPMPAAQ